MLGYHIERLRKIPLRLPDAEYDEVEIMSMDVVGLRKHWFLGGNGGFVLSG